MKVGGEVEYIDQNEYMKKYMGSRCFIVEEVRENGWIWSSQFPYAYQIGDPSRKNFHNANRFKISTRQTRNQKLEDLGI
jgi:hypothetical protein